MKITAQNNLKQLALTVHGITIERAYNGKDSCS